MHLADAFIQSDLHCIQVTVFLHFISSCFPWESSFFIIILIIIIYLRTKNNGAQNQHIRMISEGSCDTEDWSNDYWKISFGITRINYFFLFIIKQLLRKQFLYCNNILQHYCFYCIFDQINGERKRFISKT